MNQPQTQPTSACFGCRHTKNRWRTWRFIPYCLRYRVERNVKCLNYQGRKEDGKATGGK